MGAKLRYLGIMLLALVALGLVSETAGWIPESGIGDWLRPAGAVGAGLFIAGSALSMLSPVGRRMRQGRCARCGRSTERGQTYCNDHLKETVNEYREHAEFHRTGGRS